jgi:HTH-type transcriptional regulator, transcriptional repressor of NAD biosynthesis genes
VTTASKLGRRGLVLGKFLPPHAGHVYLIEAARRLVDQLTVVVGTLASEPIPGAVRHAWMRQLFPTLDIVHLTDENPQHPGEHPEFWAIWRASLGRVLSAPPDVVFASEAYGKPLAGLFGARFVPVDPGRVAIPISGTAVRADPLAAWAYLPGCVRAHYAVRVCVFGPESTGKSTLAGQLGREFGTVVVPEYARTYLEHRGGALAQADLPAIALGQAASEDALAPTCDRVLVCDTDPLLTRVWSETLFGSCPEVIDRVARDRHYDLTLVTDVDVPWVADPVRYLPDDRRGFLARCITALETCGRRYVIVRGGAAERLAAARAAITAAVRSRTRA